MQNNLSTLTEIAQRAHYHTSFSPERRGEQLIKEFQETLNEDIAFLQAQGIEETIIAGYVEKFKSLLTSWLRAKGNCTSTMITGGSNYNVRRADKANRSERRHYEVFAEWRERAKRAIVRKPKEAKTYSSEAERYKTQLAQLEATIIKMKEANKRIKAARASGEDISEYLINELGAAPHMIDWHMRLGFNTTNTNANIKRLKERIALMEKKEIVATEKGNTEHNFEGYKVIENRELDRVQIIHDTKPAPSVITLLKSKGFKWSPAQQAWQRQLTGNAISVVNQLIKSGALAA